MGLLFAMSRVGMQLAIPSLGGNGKMWLMLSSKCQINLPEWNIVCSVDLAYLPFPYYLIENEKN